MKKRLLLSLMLTVVFVETPTAVAAFSCEAIVQACAKSGFLVDGGAKPKTDLWKDCAMPLYNGEKTSSKLPKIGKKTLARCRKENPAFGQKGGEM